MTEHGQNGRGAESNGGGARLVPSGANGRPGELPPWLARHPWVPFVVPFAVYMLCGSFEPTAEKPFELGPITIAYAAYPKVYLAKILFTLAAVVAVWPGYRQFRSGVTLLSVVVGVVGVVLWIGICKLDLEATLLGPLGLGSVLSLGKRSAFDPFEQWGGETFWIWSYLSLRFFGLVAVVPLVEEFFLRGFVMRFIIGPEWWKIPFGTLTPAAIFAGTLVGVLLHPSELFAAAVWFSLVTWLMYMTRSIWDCVAAHAVTNLLLGVWVLASGEWYFL